MEVCKGRWEKVKRKYIEFSKFMLFNINRTSCGILFMIKMRRNLTESLISHRGNLDVPPNFT